MTDYMFSGVFYRVEYDDDTEAYSLNKIEVFSKATISLTREAVLAICDMIKNDDRCKAQYVLGSIWDARVNRGGEVPTVHEYKVTESPVESDKPSGVQSPSEPTNRVQGATATEYEPIEKVELLLSDDYSICAKVRLPYDMRMRFGHEFDDLGKFVLFDNSDRKHGYVLHDDDLERLIEEAYDYCIGWEKE